VSRQQDVSAKSDDRVHGGGKKRHGRFEVWLSWETRFAKHKPFRFRSYERRDVAEKAIEDFCRKWGDGFKFELRVTSNGDRKPEDPCSADRLNKITSSFQSSKAEKE